MSIAENLKKIKARAGNATVIAVSKQQPQEKIDEALAAGHRVYGENRVQEAQAHWNGAHEKFPDLELHLIGSLQTNKAKDAVALFDVIQTVDREKLAKALAAEMKKQNKFPACYIEVNTGEEEQKGGVAPAALPDLLKSCKECGLTITGLMCIPPIEDPPALHFALLKKLADEHGLKNISMGMSMDFEKALALGATHVRVGEAIFGTRVPRKPAQ
ncbi:MAG TPA: YggS family pyridoxal phosphate-dependent enzyme [Alphaproteobacteria bacterium]|nr:YggS family pyridoxal phosphate-dependent enzyme [Micavibrio sp.]MBK9562376.1 YggS family pyridoxal phosphate-dependent enzyme [Micavibrio sp.]HQX26944.1 YggS family pyridoxal phosphate-dependent enzyme [Alphaproteobacteria bacterium]